MSKGSEVVFGYTVTYAPIQGDEQPFTTNQIHKPVDRNFYAATVIRPVVYQAEPGWKIDASDPYIPVVIGPRGQRVPLNKAIAQGHVVVESKWERDQVQALAVDLGTAEEEIAGEGRRATMGRHPLPPPAVGPWRWSPSGGNFHVPPSRLVRGGSFSQEEDGVASSLLFQKLAKIIGDIARVPKRGRNEFHKYDYVTEADLLDAVREKLAAAHIAYFFSVDSVTVRPTDQKAGPITEVAVTATFADGDTGETFSVKGAGAGQDAGDKGLYKAITGAQKYVVMKTFMVPTGDDPEIDDEKPAASKRVASGGKTAGQAKPSEAATPVEPKVTPSVTVEGGDAEIPSGKYQGRTVNSLLLDEAEDLLGKLPKGNRWHTLVGKRVTALKAAASDPALAAAAETLDLVATK